jgi:molecular chaperone GrpE
MVKNNDEKQDKNEEITDVEVQAEETELEEIEELNTDKIKDLREKIKRLQDEKREILEESQRSKAEFLNAKKRIEEEKRQEKKRLQRKHAEELLPLCDSFQMAMSNTEVWEKADKAWRTGIEGINMQLLNILSSYGVSTIEPAGEPFDPNKHEAIGTEEVTDEKLQDAVVSVVQRGYEITQDGDTHLLRPARVTTGIIKDK